MPFLLTMPAGQSLSTSTGLAVPNVYVIIDEVQYSRRGLSQKTIRATIGYYKDEEASRTLSALTLTGLPGGFPVEVSPEEANAVPIFQYLESVLQGHLTALLPTGATFETVS